MTKYGEICAKEVCDLQNLKTYSKGSIREKKVKQASSINRDAQIFYLPTHTKHIPIQFFLSISDNLGQN